MTEHVVRRGEAAEGPFALVITPKTAGNHIERIYAKAGVTTRPAATLFAMQHGLLRSLEPID